jgi:hypothetical protein
MNRYRVQFIMFNFGEYFTWFIRMLVIWSNPYVMEFSSCVPFDCLLCIANQHARRGGL